MALNLLQVTSAHMFSPVPSFPCSNKPQPNLTRTSESSMQVLLFLPPLFKVNSSTDNLPILGGFKGPHLAPSRCAIQRTQRLQRQIRLAPLSQRSPLRYALNPSIPINLSPIRLGSSLTYRQLQTRGGPLVPTPPSPTPILGPTFPNHRHRPPPRRSRHRIPHDALARTHEMALQLRHDPTRRRGPQLPLRCSVQDNQGRAREVSNRYLSHG